MAGFSRKDDAFRGYALNAPPLRVLLTSCMPLALYQVLQAVFKILDAVMAAHVGAEEVSAVSCLSQITLMITALGTGLAVGGSIKISEAYGKGDDALVRKHVANVYAMAILVSAVVAVVLIPFAVPFLRLLRTSEELIAISTGYFRVEVLTLVLNFFNTVYIAVERSRGHAQKILWLNLAMVLIKLGLSALFVYGLGQGLVMIAVATLIGQVAMTAYILVSMARDEGAFRFSPKNIDLCAGAVLPVVDLSCPVAAEKMLFAGGKVIVNAMSGLYGALTVGALGISNNIGGLTTNWHMGLTDGAAPLISQNRGAGRYRRTLQLYYRLLAVDILIGVIGIAVVSATLPLLADLFAQSRTDYNAEFRDMIVSIHQWEMLGYVTLGVNSATIALLMGYGYTKRTMVLNVMRVFLYRVPVLWAFQRFTQLGAEAVGLTMMISNIATGVTAVAMAVPVVRGIRRLAREEERAGAARAPAPGGKAGQA